MLWLSQMLGDKAVATNGLQAFTSFISPCLHGDVGESRQLYVHTLSYVELIA